ncbi:hypothetical protein [Caminibacter sp.]
MKKLLAVIGLSSFMFAASVYNQGLYAFLKGNYSLAYQKWIQACNVEKNAWGCFSAAQLLEKGEGVKKDPKRAKLLYEKACKFGLKVACKK